MSRVVMVLAWVMGAGLLASACSSDKGAEGSPIGSTGCWSCTIAACPSADACYADQFCGPYLKCLEKCPGGADCSDLCPEVDKDIEASADLAEAVFGCFVQIAYEESGGCHATCQDEGVIGCDKEDCAVGQVCRPPTPTSTIDRCLSPGTAGEGCDDDDHCAAGLECKDDACVPGGSGGPDACEELGDCDSCDDTCQRVVDQGDEDSCQQALDAFRSLDLCP